MGKLSLETWVSRMPEIIAGNMDGEVVMMSVDAGQYYNLGVMGGNIWEMLAVPIQVATIVEKLFAEYEVEESVCRAEVFAFLEDLLAQRLIIVI